MNFCKNCALSFVVAVLFCSLSMSPDSASGSGGVPISVDSRIKTFVYSENEVFQVVFNYGYQSYIEFSKGETVKVLALGDNVNWKVKSVDNKLFVMPLEKNGHTNMLLETTKGRNYAFDLISRDSTQAAPTSPDSLVALATENAELTDLAYIVRFFYLEDREKDASKKAVELSAPSMAKRKETETKVELKPNDTTKDYTFSAPSTASALIPALTYDDGNLTYFKFSDPTAPLPKIYVLGDSGEKTPCRMLLLEDHVIVEGVHRRLLLDYGRSSVVVTHVVHN
ncbi:type IV secretion system protein virB9 [Anaplasma platys]|uniref:Type IV secretion system protein virB9 n=2 Tax=Anaplasma platys TaxID=949 RepID=A0A858PX54_9RICK|nr:type IV secretion system protein virB9 [Anaplasma platys]